MNKTNLIKKKCYILEKLNTIKYDNKVFFFKKKLVRVL